MLPFLIVMILIVFVIPITIAILRRPQSRSFGQWWRAGHDRTTSARQLAERYGFLYAGRSEEERNRVAHFFIFRHKPAAVVDEVVIHDDASMRESVFTCYDRTRWPSTFAHFTSPALDLPEFHMNARDYPLRDMTSAPLAFHESPAFDAAYEVRGPDEAPIRDLLDSFKRGPLATHKGFWIEGKGRDLLCGRSEDYTQLEERDAFFREARDICAVFKA